MPDYGLINFDHSILSDFFAKDEINSLDEGYKFCSEFKPIGPVFSPLTKFRYLKSYDIENVFAFDNLILNVDRGGPRNKPNLLIGDSGFLLIDHELILPFINGIEEGMDFSFKQKFNSFSQYQRHIFYHSLKKTKAIEKEYLFDEFIEMLRYENFEMLKDLFNELERFNIEFGEKNNIFAYFDWVKSNLDFIQKQLVERII